MNLSQIYIWFNKRRIVVLLTLIEVVKFLVTAPLVLEKQLGFKYIKFTNAVCIWVGKA